jgi:hypothetical protein
MELAKPRDLLKYFEATRHLSPDHADTLPVTDTHMNAILSSFEVAEHAGQLGGTMTPLTTSAMISALAEVCASVLV